MLERYILGETSYTEEEQIRLHGIDTRYRKRLKELKQQLKDLRPNDPPPRIDDYTEPIPPQETVPIPQEGEPIQYVSAEEWTDGLQFIEDYDDWKKRGSTEWQEVLDDYQAVAAALRRAEAEFINAVRQARFNQLGGKYEAILEDAAELTRIVILSEYAEADEQKRQGKVFQARHIRVDEHNNIYLDAARMFDIIKEFALPLHYNHFKGHTTPTEELTRTVQEVLTKHPYVSVEGILGGRVNAEKEVLKLQPFIRPYEYTWPATKATSEVFNGLPENIETALSMGTRRGKEINTYVMLETDSKEIKGAEGLNSYDYIVHNALFSHYKAGITVVTPQMLYKTMVGDDAAKITPNHQKDIRESLERMMRTIITIDYTEEKERLPKGVTKLILKGNMVSGRIAIAEISGNEVEAFSLMDEPVLCKYADTNNHIARVDVRLRNTPINKNKETLILQEYLLSRINAMKNSSKMQNIILYETVFEELELESSSDGVLRNKKSTIRKDIGTILDYWKAENFINGYKINKKGRAFYSITIDLTENDKARLASQNKGKGLAKGGEKVMT